jgi:UDP-galactopyranose mutase
MFDYLIVGAGFAGSVLAERLSSQLGKRVLLCDKRPHIGGNAYDHYDDAGLLVHKYGPHVFHTSAPRIFKYLSQFTTWRSYEHRELARVNDQLVPFPIDVDAIHLESYARKLWGFPCDLGASIAARFARHFTDVFQAMPLNGYTRLFENMLDHDGITLALNTDYRDLVDEVRFERMIYTAPLDAYFDYRFGKLPYRSLEFKFETHDTEVFQPAAIVNHPNDNAYTRITEFKHLTGQSHPKTTIVYEFPCADGDPYYPVPRPENAEMYRRYKSLADRIDDVRFVGRLATYRDWDMDEVVEQSLAMFDEIRGAPETRAA